MRLSDRDAGHDMEHGGRSGMVSKSSPIPSDQPGPLQDQDELRIGR